jgi:hypothetical protein
MIGKNEFASANLTAGQLNAIVKKLGGEEGALRFLRGEAVVNAVRFRLAPIFCNDKTKDGWELISDDKTSEGDFEPELMGFLREGESSVIGATMLERTNEGAAGQHYAEAMLRNQNAIPVEWRKYMLVFTGTVWRTSGGDCVVPYLFWHGSNWDLHTRWLGHSFDSNYRVIRPSN